MIVGIGVDIVDLARFSRAVSRTPRLVDRLFAESERALPAHSLAARFAAKEALIKALGGSDGVFWQDVEVVSNGEGDPGFVLHNSVAELVATRCITRMHLTMTHDAGIACAFVVAEADGGAGAAAGGAAAVGAAETADADAAAGTEARTSGGDRG
jgi:holo-[acyl-carrier protein] synthase